MSGLFRYLIAAGVGGSIFLWLPREGVIASTQELIAFLAFVMAGILPAMVLTATILRAAKLSPKRIDELGKALEAQLRFWAKLFVTAGVACAAIVLSKVFHGQVGDAVSLWTWNISFGRLQSAFIVIAGAGTIVVSARLKRAYDGLVSILHLNVQLAKSEAVENVTNSLANFDKKIEASKSQGMPLPKRISA